MVEKLGSGSYASCYRAKNELGENVAIKVFVKTDSFLDNENNAENLANEIAIMSFCSSCPTIVKFINWTSSHENIYVIMEYANNGVLAHMINMVDTKKIKVPLPILKRAFFDLASACSFLGKRSIVHMDIHPGNILVTLDGHFKLADFGLAEVQTSTSGTDLSSLPRHYPPEVLYDGMAYTTKSDIWSVAHALISFIIGQVFPSDKMDDHLLEISKKQPNLRRFIDIISRNVACRKAFMRMSACELFEASITSHFMQLCDIKLSGAELDLLAELASRQSSPFEGLDSSQCTTDYEKSENFDDELEQIVEDIYSELEHPSESSETDEDND